MRGWGDEFRVRLTNVPKKEEIGDKPPELVLLENQAGIEIDRVGRYHLDRQQPWQVDMRRLPTPSFLQYPELCVKNPFLTAWPVHKN